MKLLLAVSVLALGLSDIASASPLIADSSPLLLASRHARMSKAKRGDGGVLEFGARRLYRRCSARQRAGGQLVGEGNTNNVQAATSSGGTIKAGSGACGSPNASPETTTTSGPNGSIDYLNCGIDSSGWNPPFIHASDIVSVDLRNAVNDGSSPFKACSAYIDLFEKYAGQHGFSATILAAFAMQESSCNPDTTGGAGEQGLMQITKDKCGGAPGGNCKDPDFNIRTGAQFFADTLKSNNDDFLLSVGTYNGWSKGLTVSKATAAKNTGCCRCQNNLDYIHQFVNGWLQNKNAYDSRDRLGKYFNLDACGN